MNLPPAKGSVHDPTYIFERVATLFMTVKGLCIHTTSATSTAKVCMWLVVTVTVRSTLARMIETVAGFKGSPWWKGGVCVVRNYRGVLKGGSQTCQGQGHPTCSYWLVNTAMMTQSKCTFKLCFSSSCLIFFPTLMLNY